MTNRKKQDSLVRGIKAIISTNRRSLSEQEVKTLEDCISFLKEISDTPDDKFWLSKEFEQVTKLLIRLLANDEIFNALKDWIS